MLRNRFAKHPSSRWCVRQPRSRRYSRLEPPCHGERGRLATDWSLAAPSPKELAGLRSVRTLASAGAFGFVLAAAVGCGGDRFTSGSDAEGGRTAGATGGAAEAGGAGGASLGGGGQGGTFTGESGSAGEGGFPVQEPIALVLPIERDEDDAVFIIEDGEFAEHLKYPARTDIEVGTDVEEGHIGLRFTLPVPPTSRILRASLELTRTDGTADPSDTMTVEVYDSAKVPLFNDQHRHRPAAHAQRGVWSTAVNGFAVGDILTGEAAVSPDIAELVQHVIDRTEYRANDSIGFVLSADQMSGYAIFADSSSTEHEAAVLRVEYQPP